MIHIKKEFKSLDDGWGVKVAGYEVKTDGHFDLHDEMKKDWEAMRNLRAQVAKGPIRIIKTVYAHPNYGTGVTEYLRPLRKAPMPEEKAYFENNP